MDFDPRITSDGSGYGSAYGWHCNFHFGCGQDIIHEDFENKKSCMRVLPLLTAKADAEICDLEDELAILQCQLKWAESDIHVDPYELFCAIFESKIDSLTSAIESLKNGDGLSEHLLDSTWELEIPAERICDIIYSLMRPELPDFNEEVSTGGEDPKSDALRHDQSEKSMAGTEISNATTSLVPAEKEVIAKVKQEYDIYFQLDASGSCTKAQNYEREVVKDHLKAVELEHEDHSGVTYAKSSLSAILKPQGQKVRQKPLSDAETSQGLNASHATCKVSNGLHVPPGTNSQGELKIEEDMIYANPFQAKRKLKTGRDGGNIESPNVKVSNGEPLSARGRQMTLESPIYDLKTLRLKLAKDPDYLARLRLHELKAILRQNKITGLTKSKKELIIEVLVNQLGLSQK